MHKPLRINRLTLSFPQKTCFQDFTTDIRHGSRIAIMGQNGSGKSSLLKLLSGEIDSYEGEVKHPADLVLAYVPQMVADYRTQLSGGQAFNRALSKALSRSPNLLLLDEPTNHLDKIQGLFMTKYKPSIVQLFFSQQSTKDLVNLDSDFCLF